MVVMTAFIVAFAGGSSPSMFVDATVDLRDLRKSKADRLDLNRCIVKNESWPILRELPLQSLRVIDMVLADEHLADIGAMGELRQLEISGCSITERGIQKLTNIKNLKSLTLSRNMLTSKCLRVIAQGKQLRALTLFETRISSRDVGQLKVLKNLEQLNISGNLRVDDAVAETLGSFKSLREINANGTKVGDNVVKLLGTLEKLEVVE
ncbi:MAG: protein phosphatase 1 regulatory subunit 42, partial [Nitrososphaera sp.]|nr:protein phosphatase 1 regulatory subunit 42 [Nitrososphaera sp.]